MAKDPAFLFYPGDWLGGTIGMTLEEKGAYMELLMMQFSRGHMTSHMIGQAVGQLWDKVKDKFIQDDEGRWYNQRLDLEKTKRKEFTSSRKNNLNGTNQHSKNIGHMSGHMTSHMENGDGNENKNRTKRRKPKIFQPPNVLEVIEYFKERGYSETGARKAFDYYATADWVDSKGNKVNNWKQKMISIWMKDEFRVTITQPESQQERLARLKLEDTGRL